MILNKDITFIIWNNHHLKYHTHAYAIALNLLDHIIYRHELNKGKYKWVEHLTIEDITSCDTPFAFILKVGSWIDVNDLRHNVYPEDSLVGHILDRKEKYYELHYQNFIVKVEDVADCDFYKDTTYRAVNRSNDNFHDDYTPLWISDGGDELHVEAPLFGAGVISKLLRKGKLIKPWPGGFRRSKGFLYPEQIFKKIPNMMHKVEDKVYSMSTEGLIRDVNLYGYKHFVGTANCLQALAYIRSDIETVVFLDYSQRSIDFTNNFIFNWNPTTSYQEFLTKNNIWFDNRRTHPWSLFPDEWLLEVMEYNPDFLDVLLKIRKGDIQVWSYNLNMLGSEDVCPYVDKDNTIIYFSNVLSFNKTSNSISLIDSDLVWQRIMRVAGKNSLWLGEVPYRGNVFEKGETTTVYQKVPELNTVWRTKTYNTYYTSAMENIYRSKSINVTPLGKNKKIIAGGCSFTNYLWNPDKTSWPYVIANSLGLECIDLAMSGANNDYITDKIIQTIIKDYKNISLVCILWTEWTRINFMSSFFMNPGREINDSDNYLSTTSKWLKLKSYINHNVEYDGHEEIEKNILHHFIYSNVLAVKSVCREYDIPFICYQGITPTRENGIFGIETLNKRKNYIDWLIDLDINIEEFIGWPIFKGINGWCYQDIQTTEDQINSNDIHPNSKGHERIAYEFLNKYEEVYKDSAL